MTHWDKKQTLEGLLKLKVNSYRAAFERPSAGWTSWSGTEHTVGFQTMDEGGALSLRLAYGQKNALTGETANLDYTVRVTATPCYYGNVRYWFHCPGCDRRCGVLYQKGTHFACRSCHKLTYAARQENRRGDFYPMLKEVQSIRLFEAVQKEVSTPFYAGKPTRKYRKLVRLYTRVQHYSQAMQQNAQKMGWI
jgi:hypothetical protein